MRWSSLKSEHVERSTVVHGRILVTKRVSEQISQVLQLLLDRVLFNIELVYWKLLR